MVRTELAGGDPGGTGDGTSASVPSGIGTGRRGGGGGVAFWLAGKEVWGTWASYVLTGLFALLLGFVVVPALAGFVHIEGYGTVGRRIEAFLGAFLPDYLFLMICATLGLNVISGRYALSWHDPFSRLHFLRRLPISSGTLVAGRALTMLFSLAVNASAFFLPVFFLSYLGKLGPSYPWFVAAWTGYCLLASGFLLLCELTVGGGTYAAIQSAFAVSLMVLLALLEWTVDLRLVERMADLAQGGYGPSFAALSLLVGAAAFALLARLAASLLQRRDLSESPPV